jgi:hypothetical protein
VCRVSSTDGVEDLREHPRLEDEDDNAGEAAGVATKLPHGLSVNVLTLGRVEEQHGGRARAQSRSVWRHWFSLTRTPRGRRKSSNLQDEIQRRGRALLP